MGLSQQLLDWARLAYASQEMPCVSQVLKAPNKIGDGHRSPFTVVALDNGAVGICYNLFHRDPGLLERYYAWHTDRLLHKPALELAQQFLSVDPIDRTLGFAALNALCQHLLLAEPREYGLNFQRSVLDLAVPDASDVLGLVGYFPRYVDRLLGQVAELLVIEKSSELLDRAYPFTMTADPSALANCNKILITATTILNDTLEELLANCGRADFVAVIGPSAAICPQPLFALGVSAVGGTLITRPRVFLQRFSAGVKWGDAKQKFVISSPQVTGR